MAFTPDPTLMDLILGQDPTKRDGNMELQDELWNNDDFLNNLLNTTADLLPDVIEDFGQDAASDSGSSVIEAGSALMRCFSNSDALSPTLNGMETLKEESVSDNETVKSEGGTEYCIVSGESNHEIIQVEFDGRNSPYLEDGGLFLVTEEGSNRKITKIIKSVRKPENGVASTNINNLLKMARDAGICSEENQTLDLDSMGFFNINDMMMEAGGGTSASETSSVRAGGDSGGEDSNSDFGYPRLVLTEEERELIVKEGVKLPTHYPLTRAEERELKRIKRKIRNKISAQDSRRRKKEYVDNLEKRLQKVTDENDSLRKRLKLAKKQNTVLVQEMRKMKAVLTHHVAAATATPQTQPSTALMVLIMSLVLVLAPVLKNPASSNVPSAADDEGISLSEDGSSPLAGGSRNLLFSHLRNRGVGSEEGQCDVSDEEAVKTLTQQLQEKMGATNLDFNSLTSLLSGMMQMNGNTNSKEVPPTLVKGFNSVSSLLKEHDYFKPKKCQDLEFLRMNDTDEDEEVNVVLERKRARFMDLTKE